MEKPSQGLMRCFSLNLYQRSMLFAKSFIYLLLAVYHPRERENNKVILRGCLCDNCTPSFLPLLIFDWHTFSRRVTARWRRQLAKNKVSTSQNSRNRWCLIVRRTICNIYRDLKFKIWLSLHLQVEHFFKSLVNRLANYC